MSIYAAIFWFLYGVVSTLLVQRTIKSDRVTRRNKRWDRLRAERQYRLDKWGEDA